MQLTQLSMVLSTVLDALVVALLPVVLDARAAVDALLATAAVAAAVPELVEVEDDAEALGVVALVVVALVEGVLVTPLLLPAVVLLLAVPALVVVAGLLVVPVLLPVLLEVDDEVAELAEAVVAPSVDVALLPMLQPAITVSNNAPMTAQLLLNECTTALVAHGESWRSTNKFISGRLLRENNLAIANHFA